METIKRICRTAEFLTQLKRCADNSTVRKSAAHKNILAGITKANIESTLVLARGSYARGDYCGHSDLDLVVLLKKDQDGSATKKKLITSLRGDFDQLGIDILSDSDILKRADRMTFWLCAMEAEFIAGSRQRFVEHKSIWNELFLSIPLEKFVLMYRNDPRRHTAYFNRESPFGWNLKRAIGGIVEYEFGNLVKIWLMSKKKLTSEQEMLLKISQVAFSYLFALKSFLHDRFDCPRETIAYGRDGDSPETVPYVFSQIVAGKVLSEHHRVIERLISTLD